jgi:signal transduction histidine kinase
VSFGLGGPLGLVSLLQRLRRSSGAERAQLQWLVLGGVGLLVCFGVSFLLPDGAEDVVFGLALLCIPLSVLVAIVRHGLFDVELVLSRAIVLALLSALVLACYAAVVALVGALTPDRGSAYVVVAVVALLAATGRGALQAGVDRLLYGERRDPYAVVERIGRRLELATGPADAVEALVHELRSVLRLPYAGVLPEDGRLRPVEDGAAPYDVEVLPLTASGRPVGQLRVGHRSRGEEFTTPERAALTDVGRRLGALLEAGSLTHELQRSRERLVAAREEERRRLRHDLHDGVGPELAGMALQLDSLSARLAGDPDLAARAARLRDQMRRTVAEVRRAVDDLRPPALDQLGLAGALREQVSAYGWVEVEVGELPALPAAVEVAAYRIAGEAVANAVRHSGARQCVLRVSVEDDVEEGWLVVEVVDDGQGLAPDAPPGVGLTSMRERAAEVGGRFEVGPGPTGGTVLRARLPRGAS